MLPPQRGSPLALKIVIVGNGVAGITCAFEARRRDPEAEIAVISGETPYFFSRTALMYAFMDRMTRRNLEPYERRVYDKQGIRRIQDWVVDHDASAKTVRLESGVELSYDKLVLAVGAAPNMFPWAGADAVEDGLVHFVSMQDLDACERLTPSTRQAVVVGGGLIGIELTECLRHHGVSVTFLIREPWYWPMALGPEEAEFVAEHMGEHGVDVALTEEMTRIDVDGDGRVESVTTDAGRTIRCQMLGIAAGVRPNIERLKAFADAPEMDRGIIVDERFETSIPDVFAAGDCVSIHHSDGRAPYGEQIWYSAKRHGAVVAANLFGDGVTYEPPIFFNSSKFYEIEYTTVGDVVQLPGGTMSLYRRMPGKPISQRIVYRDDRVIGFNMLGSRWNHEVLETWVRERRSPDYVRRNLRAAQFDNEFGRVNLDRMSEQTLPIADWTHHLEGRS